MKNEFLIRSLEKSLGDNPNNVQARYELGRLHEEDASFTHAVRELEKALQLQPYHIPSRFELGVVYTRMKAYDNAVSTWLQLLDEDGDFTVEGVDQSRPTVVAACAEWDRYREQQQSPNVFVHFNVGFAYFVLGRAQEAMHELQEVLTINPRFDGANYYMALACKKQGSQHQAADCLKRELDNRPQFSQGWYQLGLAMMRRNNHAQATTHLQKALQLKPRYAKAHFHLGLVYATQGQWSSAIQHMEKATELRPGFHEAYFQIAQIHEKQYEMGPAIAAYERALEVNPRFKMAHFHLALLQKNMGKLEAALREFKQVVDIDPLDGDAYYYMGLVHSQLGQHDEAANNHERALRASPDHAFANYALGQAYLKIGREKEAIATYRKALERNPRDTQARNALGVALFQEGALEDAVVEFEKVVEANPRDSEAHYFLGAAFFKLQRLDRAIDEYTRVASIDPDSPYAHFALGASCSHSGEYDRAVDEYAKASSKMNASSESDIALFSTLQLLAAIGVDHARKATKLEVAVKQLQEVYVNTVKALTNAIDARDAYTQFHSKRVSNIARHFAMFLGMSESEVTAIEMGGYVHDVGKIGVPDYVLRKEGKLTDEERLVIETHPTIGADILENLPLPWKILDIVRHHHEKWDGSGYPQGLKGGQIPRNAQIVSISDMWDALVTARPYKPAYSFNKSVEILQSHSGTYFDPALVDQFINGFADELVLLT